jgi:hypothetical protein
MGAFKDSPENSEPEELKAFRNWQWASIGIAPPPQPALNAILKTASPEAAKSAADLAAKAIADAKQEKDGWLASLSNRDQLLGMLTAKAEGDELQLSLSSSQIEQIFATVLESKLTTHPTTNRSN